MTEITINPAYIVAVIYAIFKAVASVWICKREFQYPIWNGDGIQIPRGIQHKLQSFLRNWAINPEWGILKLIAFAPVFVATGKRFIHSFMPWRVQKVPPLCKKCKDKGKYYVQSFLVGEGGWQKCKCQNTKVQEVPACSCHVCLDQGTIGKNRPCPHCEHRGIFVSGVRRAIADNEAEVKIKNPEPHAVDATWNEDAGLWDDHEACVKTSKCAKCGTNFVVPASWGGETYRWCAACYKASFYHTVIAPDETWDERTLDAKPYRYLNHDPFCGDPHNEKECDNWLDRPSLKKKQPTGLNVGDAILIRSAHTGHQEQHLIGKSLCILGLNLPFAVVKLFADESKTYIVNLRGMTVYTTLEHPRPIWAGEPRIEGSKLHQPLLDPTALRVGDKFVVLNVHENGPDSQSAPEIPRRPIPDASYRGQAFQVTKPAFREGLAYYIPKGSLAFECKRLSLYDHEPLQMACEGLMIIPVNDEYVQAARTGRVI